MIADPDLNARLDQRLSNVGLDIREPHGEVRLECEDSVHLGTGEGGDFGFLAPRLRRTHGKTGYADDPLLLPEGVEHFGGLLGEADDAMRVARVHRGGPYSAASASAPAAPSTMAWASPGAVAST